MDVDDRELPSCNDVSLPRHLSMDSESLPVHLSMDSEGCVLVADRTKHHILLLSSQLGLERRVFIDKTNSQGKLWHPWRLSYNELKSKLYVVHSSSKELWHDVISLFNVD